MISLELIGKSLGGERVLGKDVKSLRGAHALIRHGLPAESAFYLQSLLDVSDREFSATLAVSEKWLSRHRKNPSKPLDPNVSDRLYRIARILTLAEEVMEGQKTA